MRWMWDIKFRIFNYRTDNWGALTLTCERSLKELEINLMWILLYFTYLKVKVLWLKYLWFRLLNMMIFLWLNTCYVLNVPWFMKNDYFRKVYFRWHMVRTVSHPLREKNIARCDVIKRIIAKWSWVISCHILYWFRSLIFGDHWMGKCVASVNHIRF